MHSRIFPFLLVVALLVPVLATAQETSGCSPEFRAIADHARVEIKGTGDMDIVVVTDPLCWHCRLGHKLLGEYPELYRSMKLFFYPRKAFLGSDMAAWLLEDAAGTDRVEKMVDYAYTRLGKPKTEDLDEARSLVLIQFIQAFPELVDGTTPAKLYMRLKGTYEGRVNAGADLARKAGLPGTPMLMAGKVMVLGYTPDEWLGALEEKQVCPE